MRITDPQLVFKYGAMGSAKTAHALMTAYNYRENGLRVNLYKPAIDTRDGENIIRSRTGLQAECEPLEILFDYQSRFPGSLFDYLRENVDVIIVDEVQFASAKQVDYLSDIVDALGIHVLCYGLKTDFQGSLFEGSKRLIELADVVEEIQGVCTCGNIARFNLRIDVDGNAVTAGEQVELGANDRYTAVCRKCYKKQMGNAFRNMTSTPTNLSQKQMLSYLKKVMVDKSFLHSWYIRHATEENSAIWTELHIDELCKDFAVIPNAIISGESIDFHGFICMDGNEQVQITDILLANRIMQNARKRDQAKK